MYLKADHADSLQLGNGLSKRHQSQHLWEGNSLEGSVQGSNKNNLSPEKTFPDTLQHFIIFKLLYISLRILTKKTAPVGHLFAPVDNIRKELTLVNPNHIKLSDGKKVLKP